MGRQLSGRALVVESSIAAFVTSDLRSRKVRRGPPKALMTTVRDCMDQFGAGVWRSPTQSAYARRRRRCSRAGGGGKVTSVPAGYIFFRRWLGLVMTPSRWSGASVFRFT